MGWGGPLGYPATSAVRGGRDTWGGGEGGGARHLGTVGLELSGTGGKKRARDTWAPWVELFGIGWKWRALGILGRELLCLELDVYLSSRIMTDRRTVPILFQVFSFAFRRLTFSSMENLVPSAAHAPLLAFEFLASS